MINMHFYFRGLAAALLCVVLFWCAGCSREACVYQAGLERAVESEDLQKSSDTISENLLNTLEAEGQSTLSDGRSANMVVQTGESTAESMPQSELTAGYVYVCGAVNHPGVYPIDSDMRIFEAIELAGGFTPEADEQWLNQAEAVQDGQRLYVYSKEETAALAESGVTAEQMAGQNAGTKNGTAQKGSSQITGTQGITDQKVNLNTADRAQLMTLPGIGEAKADAILQYREQNGAFGAIEEIQNIPGIKTAVFSQIKDRITVQ